MKLIIFTIYTLGVLGTGAYFGWHSNSLYTEATQNPIGFLTKLTTGNK